MQSEELESNEFVIQYKSSMAEIDKEVSDETKQNCKSLKIINCQQVGVTPQFLSFVNKLDSLEIIETEFNPTALKELKSSQLRRLCINKCGIKDADIEGLDLPSLEILDLTSNSMQSLNSVKMGNLPKLRCLFANSNSLIFKNTDAFTSFFTELVPKLSPSFNNINLTSNPFEQKIIGYQIILLKVFNGRLETLNNANVAGINTDDLRFLDDGSDRDNQRNGGGFGNEVNLAQSGQENNFETLIDLIEEALQSPSEANKKMTDLKKHVQIFKKAKGNPFSETDTYKLKNDIEKFLKVIVLLIENQESTQDLVVEILCHLTVIVQQDFGIRSYQTLSYLAKKNKVLRRKVLYTMKELCLKNFYQKDLSSFSHKYLEAFLSVIEENSMEEIIGSTAYIYLEGWLKDIYQKNFKLEGSAGQMIKQVFRLLSIVASNPQVLFQENIITILSTNMFCKARKMQRELKSDYYIFAEYISYALMKYCERSHPEKINTSAILYEDSNYFSELINEINDIRREINGPDSSSKTALAPSFDRLLSLLSTILHTYVPRNSPTSARVVIQIDADSRFSRETNTNIFFEIALMAKSQVDIAFKASIFKFVSATLENTKLVCKINSAAAQGEPEVTHGNLVSCLDPMIRDAGMLPILAKTLENASDARYVALSYEICQVIYYYTYHSCDNPQADRAVQKICIDTSKILNDMGRDLYLFNCLEVQNDRLKLIIVKVLNSIRPEQYDDPELRKLWNILREHRNVGAGKNEIIIGTILLIMTKIKQHSEQEEKDSIDYPPRDKAALATKDKQLISSREKLSFIRSNFANFVNLALELLKKNMSRDLKDDEEEQKEKNILSLCIIIFMKAILKPPLPSSVSIESSENLENIGAILVDESIKNPRDNVICEIEATIGASNAKYMLEFTRKVNIKSFTFTRILAHIADIMEGDLSASSQFLVPQTVLLEDLLTQIEVYKEQKIQKELGDFKNVDDEDFIIGKHRQQLSANNRLSIEDIGEIHKEIFNDRGIQNLFNMILKVINAENEVATYDGDNDDEKLRHKYDEAKSIIFNKKSKVLSGQQFLIKKLSKTKDDKHFEDKVNKVTAQFRYDTTKIGVAETAPFQLVPLIPDLVVTQSSKQPPSSMKTAEPKHYLFARTDEVFCHKLFVLDLCAILRIIYNGMILGVKQDVVLEMLNDKTFLKRILKACNTAGWDNGYLSSKYLRLVKLSVEANSMSKGKSEGFRDKLTFYYMIFKSLANILDYFLQKFKKENVKNFSESQLSLLFEIVKTTHTTMTTVKDYITIENKGESEKANSDKKEAAAGKDKRFYDLYSDRESTPLQEIIRWVMSTYVPPRFIQIFVQILCRIEARVQAARFEVKRRTVSWLMEVISEYLSIFPNLRYDVIKHFYDFEQSDGIRVRASLIANILRRSFFTSKMLRVAEYMTTEEAGKAYLSEDKTILSSFYCYLVEKTKKMIPMYLVFCKQAIYLLKETLEKPSALVSMDSLSPYPPQCYEVVKYDEIVKLHKNVDLTSLRILMKNGNSTLLDFMSAEVLEKVIPFILNPPASKEETKVAIEFDNHHNRVRFKDKECDYMFNVASFATDQEVDNRGFTDIIISQPKSILAIFDKSLSLLEPDFTEAAYKEYYVKSNKKIDSMYTEVFTMHVDTVNELEFPNIETPKTIMKGKGGGGKFRHLVFFDDQDLEHFKFAITELHDEGFNPNYKTKVIEVPIP